MNLGAEGHEGGNGYCILQILQDYVLRVTALYGELTRSHTTYTTFIFVSESSCPCSRPTRILHHSLQVDRIGFCFQQAQRLIELNNITNAHKDQASAASRRWAAWAQAKADHCSDWAGPGTSVELSIEPGRDGLGDGNDTALQAAEAHAPTPSPASASLAASSSSPRNPGPHTSVPPIPLARSARRHDLCPLPHPKHMRPPPPSHAMAGFSATARLASNTRSQFSRPVSAQMQRQLTWDHAPPSRSLRPASTTMVSPFLASNARHARHLPLVRMLCLHFMY